MPALPEEVDALTFAEAQAVIAEKDAAYAGATKKLHEYRRQLATINQIAQGLASALDSHGPYLPTDPAHAALRALAAYQQRKGK